MGTSPASSEIQKRIRELLKNCENTINIKDDILVYGKGRDHDTALTTVLKVLNDSGLTVRKEKCALGQPEVKWFSNIYNKDGMSPDPEKYRIIKDWPVPKSSAEVKSFLQTVQFNSKCGANGERSYPELTNH